MKEHHEALKVLLTILVYKLESNIPCGIMGFWQKFGSESHLKTSCPLFFEELEVYWLRTVYVLVVDYGSQAYQSIIMLLPLESVVLMVGTVNGNFGIMGHVYKTGCTTRHCERYQSYTAMWAWLRLAIPAITNLCAKTATNDLGYKGTIQLNFILLQTFVPIHVMC